MARTPNRFSASLPSSVVVIGAGAAGLATACLLAKSGIKVTVVDRIEKVGGRAFSMTKDDAEGFRWDAGPSWYLMPDAFDHFYAMMGTSTDEQLHLKMLDPAYRLYPEGAAKVDVPHGRQAAVELFESIEPGAGQKLDEYLTSAADAYDIAVRRFLYTTFTSLREIVTSEVVRKSPILYRLLTESMESFAKRFVSDVRLQQILTYPAVFLSSEPSKAPSLYHLMSHADLTQGVRYPVGGFTAVMESMERLAQDCGAEFLLNTEVLAITTESTAAPTPAPVQKLANVLSALPGPQANLRRPVAKATGVTVRNPDGSVTTITADAVVSCADLHHTETALLPSDLRTYPERTWGKRDPGPSTVLVYLGVKGELPELAHHTLLFSRDWDNDFQVVYDRVTGGKLPRSESIYISCPSKSDPDVAPAGHENLFVLIPVPADPNLGRGSAFSDQPSPLVESIADAAIEQIATWCGIDDLQDRIVARYTAGPADFAERYHAFRGGSIGPAHTLFQSAFFRGTNQSALVDDLYYAGATTAPGVGIPMCLISAENVVKRLRGDRTPDRLEEPLRPLR
ncbi:phytoene desaturase family protein [Corynebacterium choanae]|uniref:Dehydrosqualene desaturase n=1 Tax=Corynebacterium choanae TaxID=1862358 RepID=A0A3G6J6A2_9CORY|nr:phytoene desaturase family protein [Corynebacterium choanae]AZA12458.1 Dehydrosqualene desaturase [Corynebacterium choanae]